MRVRRQRWYAAREWKFRYALNAARVYYLRQTVLTRPESSRGINNFYGAKIKIEISLTGAPFRPFTSPRRFSSCRRISIVEVDAPTLRYAKFIFRDPPGEAFWKFTTGSNGVEQKCQSRLREVKRVFVASYRVDTVKGADDIPRVRRHAFRFDSPSYRTLFFVTRTITRSGRIRDNRTCTHTQICTQYLF